ncbi:Cathepsin L [Oopsacas minuta]|uniref:Cathepsin L n=1 Tax=Oopsacas minuta TaxID=111878 RepID=A0AAV7KAI1_9METZ|nr:Cathepsin L [Oopsacas minuta]
MLLIALLCLCLAAVTANPDWTTSQYYAKGVITLPYGDIVEPFEAWIDPSGTKSRSAHARGSLRSRIDYYGGMNSILYNNGLGFKMVPTPDHDGKFQMVCYNVTGGIDFQSVLPDINDYKLINNKVPCSQDSNLTCNLYSFKETIGKKVNEYYMYIYGNSTPKNFYFLGFDSLFGSHYDKYIIRYDEFKLTTIPDAIFNEYMNFEKCIGFPGPGATRTFLDPMSEFIGGENSEEREKDSNSEFEDFKQKYSKTYDTYHDHESRKSTFRQARRFINSKNRENLGYTLAINHLADHTEAELYARNGHRYSGKGESHRLMDYEVPLSDIDIPDTMNWTAKGAVNPPKDQGICGSCWSFGTTGALEGGYFVLNDKLLDLSEQSLMDCSWDQGNNGCDGGETERVGEWLLEKDKNHCVVTRKEYASAANQSDVMRGYLGADGVCHWGKTDKELCVRIKDYTVSPKGNVGALRQFSAMKGPIQVAIDASRPTFSFYSSGVYYDMKCKNGVNDLDHSVLLVGYGTENGQQYWLVKNSWSTYWGDNGYIKISTKDNNCGVATDAVFFTIVNE